MTVKTLKDIKLQIVSQDPRANEMCYRCGASWVEPDTGIETCPCDLEIGTEGCFMKEEWQELLKKERGNGVKKCVFHVERK